MKTECPKCKSEHIDAVDIMGTKCLICLNCGYDESEEILDVYPESRGGKTGRSTPYRRGGGMRSMNRKN